MNVPRANANNGDALHYEPGTESLNVAQCRDASVISLLLIRPSCECLQIFVQQPPIHCSARERFNSALISFSLCDFAFVASFFRCVMPRYPRRYRSLQKRLIKTCRNVLLRGTEEILQRV